MPAVSLSSYSFRIVDRLGTPVADLTRWPDRDGFLPIIEDYLQNRRVQLFYDQDNQIALRAMGFVPGEFFLSGTVERGEYGYGSTLYDIEHNSVSYDRQPTDADLIPYHFLFETHRGANEGILLLERFGKGGIKGAIEFDLNSHIQDRYPDHRLVINPLVPQALVDQFLQNGRIVRIRLIKFEIPTDIADGYDVDHEEIDGKMELQIIANRDGQIPVIDRIRDVLAGDLEVHQFLEYEDFEYDDVKVEIKLGGKRRTIDLRYPDRFWPSTDITGEVEVDDDGHPQFESIDAIARDLASDIRRIMGAG